ncbi:MAG: hypothetical protein J6T10_13445 [Methanobrevibacter sp.]|nr:hypothetical protein [Methanobrevibacter sp.]
MKDELINGLCVGSGFTLTVLQTKEVFQIANLILTTIAFIISIFYTCWKWWKHAKADGKITEDEVDDLADKLNNLVNKNDKEN